MAAESRKRIENFLEGLRSAELPVGTQQLIAAHELLVILAARGDWPEDTSKFATLLAPILCSSPAEQKEFYRRFEDWMKAPEEWLPPPPPVPEHNRQKPSDAATKISLVIRRSIIILAFCLVLIAVPLAPIFYQGSKVVEPPSTLLKFTRTIVGPDGFPIKGALVRYRGNTTTTGSVGTFQIELKSNELPTVVLITTQSWNPKLLTLAASSPSFDLVQLAPREGTVFVPGPMVTNRQTVRLPFAHWIDVNFGNVVFVAFLLPFPLAFLYTWWRGRSVLLRKWNIPLRPRLRRFGIARPHDLLYRYNHVQRIGSELTRHRQEPSSDLDVEHTVERTLAAGNLFSPVYGERPQRPEYLCLIQRLSSNDHYSLLHDEMLDRLESAGVSIDRFYYHRDVQSCWTGRNAAKYRGFHSLPELASIYRHHSLCIFGDVEDFIDPATLQLNSASALEPWFRTAVFADPGTPKFYAVGEQLETLGGNVLEDHLEAMADLTQPPKVKIERVETEHPFPQLLSELAERWLSNQEPDSGMVERLNVQVRIYTGEDGYRCLQACAVYPGIIWDLTVHMVQEFAPGVTEIVLGKLARLPWFRYGTMPDWLRYRLLRDLGPDSRDAVLRALDRFLEDVARIDDEAGPVAIAEPLPAPGDSAESGPLEDIVYASFVLGQPVDKLSISAPRRLGRLLRKQMASAQAGWTLPASIVLFGSWAFLVLTSFAIGAIVNSSLGSRQVDVATQQPGTIKNVTNPSIRPDDLVLATVLNVAEARLGETGNSDFVPGVVTDTEQLLNQSLPRLISASATAPMVRPGLISYGSNGIVEAADRGQPSCTLIRGDVNGKVGRTIVPVASLTDRWDPSTGELYSSPQIGGKPAVSLATNFTKFDFGRVFVNSKSPPAMASLTNTGASAVTILGSGQKLGPFTIKDGCRNQLLKPGERCSIAVEFSPTSPGDYSFTYFAQVTPEVTTVVSRITFTGTGVPPAAGGAARPLISGTVHTVDGHPLPGAKVEIQNLGSAVTNESGAFSVPLPRPLSPGEPLTFSVQGWWIQGGASTMVVPASNIGAIDIIVNRPGGPQQSATGNILAAQPSLVGEWISQDAEPIDKDFGGAPSNCFYTMEISKLRTTINFDSEANLTGGGITFVYLENTRTRGCTSLPMMRKELEISTKTSQVAGDHIHIEFQDTSTQKPVVKATFDAVNSGISSTAMTGMLTLTRIEQQPPFDRLFNWEVSKMITILKASK